MTESPRRNLTESIVRRPFGKAKWIRKRVWCLHQVQVQPHVHLANEAILVHALALATLGLLSPHLLHVLQHHVAVSVKGLDTGQQLAVVAAGDQDLGVRAGGGLQQR